MDPKITYYPNGKIQYEIYVNNLNKRHNENGPSLIEYHEDGTKFCETYYNNGLWHNTNGPARIWYCESGNIISKSYWLNNEKIFVKTDEEFEKYIKLLNIS